MSHVLTQTASNANFPTGLTVPDPSESGTLWWNELITLFQQVADRETWLKGWLADTPSWRVVLNPIINTSSRFTAGSYANGGLYWHQSDVTSEGALYFPVGNLPVGRTITKVSALWNNPTNSNTAGASTIGTKPSVSLIKMHVATGTAAGFVDPSTVVTSGSDTTTLAADYQVIHEISSGTSEVISVDYEYAIKVTGEAGANSAIGGNLNGLRLTLAY